MQEEMELTDEYKSTVTALHASESSLVDYTALYNVKKPQISVVESSLRHSLTSSQLEASQQNLTLNLNSFNQQKRIQRLLQSIGAKSISVEPRSFKFNSMDEKSLKELKVELFDSQVLLNQQRQLQCTLEQNMRLSSLLTYLREHQADMGGPDASELPDEAVYEELAKSYHLTPVFLPAARQLEFGGFRADFRGQNACFTLSSARGMNLLQIELNCSIGTAQTKVFSAEMALSENFRAVYGLISQLVPAQYALVFVPQHHECTVLLPFNTAYDDFKEEFGNLLFDDFQLLLAEISRNAAEFMQLIDYIVDSNMVCYFNGDSLSVGGMDVRSIQPLIGLIGGREVVGTTQIISALKQQ